MERQESVSGLDFQPLLFQCLCAAGEKTFCCCFVCQSATLSILPVRWICAVVDAAKLALLLMFSTRLTQAIILYINIYIYMQCICIIPSVGWQDNTSFYFFDVV